MDNNNHIITYFSIQSSMSIFISEGLTSFGIICGSVYRNNGQGFGDRARRGQERGDHSTVWRVIPQMGPPQ